MTGPLAPVTDSLEVRWFVRGPLAPEAEAWFASLGPDVADETRTDRYLVPTESDDLGLKIREGTVQAKQRVGAFGMRPLAPGACGGVEAWRKWTLGSAGTVPGEGWIDVVKSRRQRPVVLLGRHARCALELSELDARGEAWWSVCLEASGASPRARWMALRESARLWLRAAPSLNEEHAMGYPAWLRRLEG